MRILFITHYADLYGANRSMIDLILRLRKMGCICTVVIPKRGKIEEILLSEGIPYVIASFSMWRKDKVTFKEHFAPFLNRFKGVKNILRACGDEYDIIHTNSSMTDVGQYLAEYLHITHVWHLREYGKWDYPKRFSLPMPYIRYVMRRSDALICISDSIKAYYQEEVCPKANYIRIYNGIESILMRRQPRTDECVTFCCIGLIAPGKRQLDILRAGSHLMSRGKKNWKIVFIGGFGDKTYGDNLRRYVKQHNMERFVDFRGYQTNPIKLLGEMDVGIMSSQCEAFGRVTVEYMMAEMPVIGSSSGGTPEIIVPGETGCVYEPGNDEQLANQMEMYIENPSLIPLHGKNGRLRAERLFTEERCAQQIYALYEELLWKRSAQSKGIPNARMLLSRHRKKQGKRIKCNRSIIPR